MNLDHSFSTPPQNGGQIWNGHSSTINLGALYLLFYFVGTVTYLHVKLKPLISKFSIYEI
ncbi:hypothetical protein C0J52_08641 [Blattella germanica]|nr:hypothetical protein C0J52_08641 [Blattella germanica]